MPIVPKRFRVVVWTVLAISLATACTIILARIRAYEREGTLLGMKAEIQSAEASKRRYQAVLDTVQEGARRAKLPNQAVVSVVRPLERKRDEAFLRSLQAQVDYSIAAFDASDVEVLTNFADFMQATNAMMRLFGVGVDTRVRAGKPDQDGVPRLFNVMVRKSEAIRAREVLPGLLAEDRAGTER